MKDITQFLMENEFTKEDEELLFDNLGLVDETIENLYGLKTFTDQMKRQKIINKTDKYIGLEIFYLNIYMNIKDKLQEIKGEENVSNAYSNNINNT